MTNIIGRRPWLQNAQNFSYGFTRLHSHPESGSRDEAIAARLIAAYRKAISQAKDTGGAADLWTGFVREYYGDMISIIEQGHASALAAYLSTLPRQGAGHGYFQGKATYDALHADPAKQRSRAIWLMDGLVAMGEATGVLPVRCPEQGEWDTCPIESASDLRDAIERKIALPITLPPVAEGMFVLEPERGPIHLRSIMAAYAIQQIAGLMHRIEGIEPSVLRIAEIGAGIGYTAYAARKRGVARYTLFDIPEVNVAQGYFLLKTLPDNDVVLCGEADDGRAAVRVLPASGFQSVPAGSFDVTINIDSMPEIAPATVAGYLAGIARQSRYFFSINQEARGVQTEQQRQFLVRDCVSASGNYQSIFRYPNWIRAGYVEELWRVRPA